MTGKPEKILIIQTAYMGDVILATSLVETIHQYYPKAKIDFLLRKGNETILLNNKAINKIHIWDKSNGKYSGVLDIAKTLKKTNYDWAINCQRFFSTGLIMYLINAKVKSCFKQNPMSYFCDQKSDFKMDGMHEIERLHSLLPQKIEIKLPKIFPSLIDEDAVLSLKSKPYICLAPASVWFTKQYPREKWIELAKSLKENYVVYLLGSFGDKRLCDKIVDEAELPYGQNLAGKFSPLESACLMRDAIMNYTNDSAPLHLCSAVNAPITAIYCSTIPDFGYTPLSDKKYVVETKMDLNCRPCNNHGKKSCPEKHFNCGNGINNEQLLASLS